MCIRAKLGCRTACLPAFSESAIRQLECAGLHCGVAGDLSVDLPHVQQSVMRQSGDAARSRPSQVGRYTKPRATPWGDGLQGVGRSGGPPRRPVRSASGRCLSEFVKDTSHGFSDRFRIVFMRTLIEIWFLAVIAKLPNGMLPGSRRTPRLCRLQRMAPP